MNNEPGGLTLLRLRSQNSSLAFDLGCQLANLWWADLWMTNLQQVRNVTAEQLSHVKTLFEAKLDPELEKELREKHPHLFEKPEKDEESDAETA